MEEKEKMKVERLQKKIIKKENTLRRLGSLGSQLRLEKQNLALKIVKVQQTPDIIEEEAEMLKTIPKENQLQ